MSYQAAAGRLKLNDWTLLSFMNTYDGAAQARATDFDKTSIIWEAAQRARAVEAQTVESHVDR